MRIVEDLIDPTKLDEVIGKTLTQMSNVGSETDEFAKMAENLLKLFRAKEIDVKAKVQAFDSAVKDTEQERLLDLRETEMSVKRNEIETNLVRLARELEIKQKELELKERQFKHELDTSAIDQNMKIETFEERRRISSDTLAIIAANLGGILLIIGYERVNVIASKAIGFVMRR